LQVSAKLNFSKTSTTNNHSNDQPAAPQNSQNVKWMAPNASDWNLWFEHTLEPYGKALMATTQYANATMFAWDHNNRNNHHIHHKKQSCNVVTKASNNDDNHNEDKDEEVKEVEAYVEVGYLKGYILKWSQPNLTMMEPLRVQNSMHLLLVSSTEMGRVGWNRNSEENVTEDETNENPRKKTFSRDTAKEGWEHIIDTIREQVHGDAHSLLWIDNTIK
jgi:hypothetical protein